MSLAVRIVTAKWRENLMWCRRAYICGRTLDSPQAAPSTSVCLSAGNIAAGEHQAALVKRDYLAEPVGVWFRADEHENGSRREMGQADCFVLSNQALGSAFEMASAYAT